MKNPKIRERAINIHLIMEWIKDQIKGEKRNYNEINDNDMDDLIKSGNEIISEMLLNKKEYKMFEMNKQIYFVRNMEWTRRSFKLKDLSNVMPSCGDIPKEILYFNDLSSIIKRLILDDELDELNTKRKCESMGKFPSLLSIPITAIQPSFFQRSIIYPEAKNTKAYIEDGNHRAIAMGIRGNTTIDCIIGIVYCNHCNAMIEENNYICINCGKKWNIEKIF